MANSTKILVLKRLGLINDYFELLVNMVNPDVHVQEKATKNDLLMNQCLEGWPAKCAREMFEIRKLWLSYGQLQ